MISREAVARLIKEARDEINITLGRCNSISSEYYGTYVYPSDLSGRLTKLQAISGKFAQNSKEVSLWDFSEDIYLSEQDNTQWESISILNLDKVIQDLRCVLNPVQGLPPLKKGIYASVESAIKKLSDAKDILENLTTQEFFANNKKWVIYLSPPPVALHYVNVKPHTLFSPPRIDSSDEHEVELQVEHEATTIAKAYNKCFVM